MAEITDETNSELVIENFQAADAGDYYCVITNDEGSVETTHVTVQLATIPVISVQPIAQTVDLGAVLTFSVTATGLPDPSYQWQKDGVDIAGETSSTLTIAASVKTDAADYKCIVSNIAGSVTSDTVSATIEYAPEFTAHPLPTSQAANVGGGLSYFVTVDAIPAATYQWELDGTPIGGETASTLTLSNVQIADGGAYTCVATNTKGSTESNAATLAIIADAPFFTDQPDTDVASVGDNVLFECVAAGAEPMTYQWYKTAVAIGGESGSTTSGATISLSLTNVQVADQGAYTCKVTNAVATTESAVAVLSIGTQAPSILVQPVLQSATTGGTAIFVIEAAGEPDVTFTWKKGGTPLSAGGDIGIVDDTVSGHQRSTLTISNIDVSDVDDYLCTVANAAGSVDSTTVPLFVDSLPVITLQPINESIDAYDDVTFLINATGSPLPTYQWYVEAGSVNLDFSSPTDEVTLTGDQLTDGDIFVFTAGQPGEFSAATQYFVINNSYGGGTNTFQLSTSRGGSAVDFTTSPTGVASALSSLIGGETLNTYTITGADPAIDGSDYFCQVINAAGEVQSDVVTLDVLSAPYITSDPLTQTLDAGLTLNLSVAVTGSSPLTYLWEYSADGATGWADVTALPGDSGQGTANLSFTAITQADHQQYYRCTVSNGAGSVISSSAQVTVNESAAALTTSNSAQFLAQTDGLDVSYFFTGAPAPSVVWEYDSTGGGVWVTLNDADPSPSASGTVTITDAAGSSRLQISNLQNGDEFEYRITVTNTGGSDSDTFALTVLTAAPSVSANPTNQSDASPPVIFSCTGTATEGETLDYTWEENTGAGFVAIPSGVDYSGEDSMTLTVTNTGPKIGYLYRCVISNEFGSVNTTSATLTA